MILVIDNQQIDTALATYRELGFGENLNIKKSNYKLELPTTEIPEKFYDAANCFIDQCKEDDSHLQTSETPELSFLGYPRAQTLTTESPEILASIIEDYLYFDVLDSLLANKNNDSKFVINSISSVEINNNKLTIIGEGFFKEHRQNNKAEN